LKERDGIKRFERRLREQGLLSEQAAAQVWDEAQAEVDEAIEFARSSPYPAPESALVGVFA
jgi:pyruvate dehydrogenase E1 component alpha subunit